MTLVAGGYAAGRGPDPGAVLAMVLAMETGLLGIFAARDLILFYVFFEWALIPSLLMLAVYGGPGRMRALVKFGAYTLLGPLLMLLSFIGYKWLGGSSTFSWPALLANPVTGASINTATGFPPPSLWRGGWLTAFYGNPRQVFVTGTLTF